MTCVHVCAFFILVNIHKVIKAAPQSYNNTTWKEEKCTLIFGQIHYKIYVFGWAHMKFSIGINAGPQAQLAVSQSKLN